MLRSSKTIVGLIVSAVLATPAWAQTTGTGTTATGTATGTGVAGGAPTISGGGGSTTDALANTGTYTASGFTSGAGASTVTNPGATSGGMGGGKGGTTATAIAPPLSGNYGLSGAIYGNYGNVMGMGKTLIGSSNSTSGNKGAAAAAGSGFGAPVLTTTTTNVTTNKGNATTNKTNNGFSNTQIPKTPAYIAALSPKLALPARPMTQVQSDLQSIIARSTALKNKGTINVMLEGNTVVLVGQVASPDDRNLAENMLRFDLRGRNIDNRLVVPGQP